LLVALEFKDKQLLDLVVDELAKFAPDYPYMFEPLEIGEERDTYEYLTDYTMTEIYDYLLKIGDEDAIALILSTNGQTPNKLFNRWILNDEKLDYPLRTDDDIGARTLLSDKVVSSIGDDLTWIYGVNLEEDFEYLPEVVDAIYRLYQQRGHIPSGILRATGWTQQETLDDWEDYPIPDCYDRTYISYD